MKAIIIDSERRSIELINIGSGLQPIYNAIGNGCDTFAVPVTLKNGDSFYVDDEGLLKKIKGAFQIKNYHSPLMGNCVILGTDSIGNNIDVKSSVPQISKIIEFLFLVERIPIKKIVTGKPTFSIHPEAFLLIDFEDAGQDFLQWQVDSRGMVLQSNPYQTEIWKGTIIDLLRLKIDSPVFVTNDVLKNQALKYKVITVNENKKS